MAQKIQIQYLNDSGSILGTYTTDDNYTPAECRKWSEWLNDNAVEAPNQPEGWTQFDLVAVNELSADLRQELVDMVDAADLCCPEQVCDRVLAIAEQDGREAAIAEIERAKACDADESRRLGIE